MGNSVLLALSFSRDSLALKKENGALSGVVFRVQAQSPMEPYEIVTLYDIVSLIFTDWYLFCK